MWPLFALVLHSYVWAAWGGYTFGSLFPLVFFSHTLVINICCVVDIERRFALPLISTGLISLINNNRCFFYFTYNYKLLLIKYLSKIACNPFIYILNAAVDSKSFSRVYLDEIM